MLGFGVALSIGGVFVALLAIMVIFMGNEGAAVPLLLVPLLGALPLTAALAALALWRQRVRGGLLPALQACPTWLIVMLGVLLSVLGIAVLALWLATAATGEPLPPRFHLPVLALAVNGVTLGVFAGLLARRSAWSEG